MLYFLTFEVVTQIFALEKLLSHTSMFNAVLCMRTDFNKNVKIILKIISWLSFIGSFQEENKMKQNSISVGEQECL